MLRPGIIRDCAHAAASSLWVRMRIGARNGLSMLWFVLPSLRCPVIAGWLVKLYSHE